MINERDVEDAISELRAIRGVLENIDQTLTDLTSEYSDYKPKHRGRSTILGGYTDDPLGLGRKN